MIYDALLQELDLAAQPIEQLPPHTRALVELLYEALRLRNPPTNPDARAYTLGLARTILAALPQDQAPARLPAASTPLSDLEGLGAFGARVHLDTYRRAAWAAGHGSGEGEP